MQRHALLSLPPADTDSPGSFGASAMDGIDGLDGTAMDCIDGNSVWQHMLTCFDPGCPDPLCQGGKAVLKHRLSCQVCSSVASLPSSLLEESFVNQILYASQLAAPDPPAPNLQCLLPRAQDPACLLCDLICSQFKTSALSADLQPTISGAVAHDPGPCSFYLPGASYDDSTTAAAPRPRSDPDPPHDCLCPASEEDGLPSTAMVGSMGY